MVVSIYGGASSYSDEKYINAIYELASYLAKRGHSLVYGGGSSGMMGAAARGFHDNKQRVHSVVPNFFFEEGYEKLFDDYDELSKTKDMAERKAIMEEEGEAYIVTPGGVGTMEEFFQVMTLKQLARHKKPIVVYNVFGYYNALLKLFENMQKEKFTSPATTNMFVVLDTKEQVADYIENYSADFNRSVFNGTPTKLK